MRRIGANLTVTGAGELGKTRLALWAAGFVVLICIAIPERLARMTDAQRRAQECRVADVAQSLVQHADDTFELADTILVGLVHRLELDGMGPGTIAKLQTYLP